MNTEVQDYDVDLKLDANGEIDLNFYLHRAETMRAQFLSELYLSAKKKIKNTAITFYERFISVNGHPSH
ncbi:MAG: hypothetical protein GY744_16555 [Gammaproteobacteria bacterium]|nr:hypothetical protein [Gammaproteobacteria bacterium]